MARSDRTMEMPKWGDRCATAAVRDDDHATVRRSPVGHGERAWPARQWAKKGHSGLKLHPSKFNFAPPKLLIPISIHLFYFTSPNYFRLMFLINRIIQVLRLCGCLFPTYVLIQRDSNFILLKELIFVSYPLFHF